MRLRSTAAFPLSGRKPGCSSSWTSPVALEERGAPSLPPSAPRTAPRAGNPLNRLRWTRRRLRLRLWSPLRSTRPGYPRLPARGAGATPPTILPTCGQVSAGLGHQLMAAPPWPCIDPARAGSDSGGCGQPCPGPTPAYGWHGPPPFPGCRPSTAHLWLAFSWRGLSSDRANGRGLILPRPPALAHGWPFPPPEFVAQPGDPDPGRPDRKGLRHYVRSFARSLAGCGLSSALAFWPCGLGPRCA